MSQYLAPPDPADMAIRGFREFYAELHQIKQALHDSDWTSLAGGRAVPEPVQSQLAGFVQGRLQRAIAAQGFGLPPSPRAPAGVDPGYVMAAVADETLLHDVSWPARDVWAETPLEFGLYRSRTAGERIFRAVEALSRSHLQDTDGTAAAILLALELGFRGRFRSAATTADAAAIEAARQQLVSLVVHNRDALRDPALALMAGAREPLTHPQARRLPRLRPWLHVCLAVCVLYLALSWLIWHGEVQGTLDEALRITTALRAPQ
jgi:type VI secretion system protein ImpK